MNIDIIGPNEGDFESFAQFVFLTDTLFIPSLSERVDMKLYIEKMYKYGTKFIYRHDNDIKALGVTYINKAPKDSFETYVAVIPEFQHMKIGRELILKMIDYAKNYNSFGFRAKIRASNKMLCSFYLSHGFEVINTTFYPNSKLLEYEVFKRF